MLVRRLAVALTAAALACCLNACSDDNKGGDTTCGEYQGLSVDQRKAVVTKMLRDRGQATADTNVTVAMASSLLYCQTLAQATDPLEKMYSGQSSPS